MFRLFVGHAPWFCFWQSSINVWILYATLTHTNNVTWSTATPWKHTRHTINFIIKCMSVASQTKICVCAKIQMKVKIYLGKFWTWMCVDEACLFVYTHTIESEIFWCKWKVSVIGFNLTIFGASFIFPCAL